MIIHRNTEEIGLPPLGMYVGNLGRPANVRSKDKSVAYYAGGAAIVSWQHTLIRASPNILIHSKWAVSLELVAFRVIVSNSIDILDRVSSRHA